MDRVLYAEVALLKVMFPLLYGVYLALGLLALQPYQDLGFSPAGAACLFILGAGLSNFLLSVGHFPSFPLSGRLARPFLGRIAAASGMQVIGLSLFCMGLLSGAGFVFAVAALAYGTMAATVWSRFLRSKPASMWCQLGIVLSSLGVLGLALVDWGLVVGARGSDWSLLPWGITSARAFSLAGSLLWAVGHCSFEARSFPAPRGVWSLWQSVFSVFWVILAGALLSFIPNGRMILAEGFSSNPLLVVPFLLFGVVFGTLRTRLVHAWESRLSARTVHFAWTSGLLLTSAAAVVLVIPGASLGPDLSALLLMGLCLYLIRHEELVISNYRGPQRVPSYLLGR